MRKKILGILLCMAVLLSTFYNPMMTQATGEASQTSYTKSEVETFKETNTYPAKAGYVFAGWYQDEAFANPVTNTIPDVAYPKFVKQEVLTFKGQFTAGLTSASDTTDLRLITAVDSTKYQKVGFELQIGESSTDLNSTTVYRSLFGYVDDQEQSYTAAGVFGEPAAYFMTAVLSNIPNADFNQGFTVTPYWVTLDGTKVEGGCREITVSGAIPVGLSLTMNNVEDNTQVAGQEELMVLVNENLKTEFLLNGNESTVKTLSIAQESWTNGRYVTRVYMKDFVNSMPLGENTLSIRVTKVDSIGQSYVTEKSVKYNNTGFLYTRAETGTLTTVKDGEETVLKYSQTGDEWYGLGSKYIAPGAGETQGKAGFNSDGIQYVSMKVKVENATGLNVFYSAPSNTYQVSTTINVDASSEYLDQNGIKGTLKNGEWITLKVPVKTDDPTSPWHMFTMQPKGEDSALYIKDVRYEKSAYVAPVGTLTAVIEPGAAGDDIRIDCSEELPVEVIVNGDESKKFVVTGFSKITWAPYTYAAWYGVKNIVNALDIGTNTLTIRATKTVDGGTLVAETKINYENTGFLYTRAETGTLTTVKDGEETVLKYSQTGSEWYGLGSKYIAPGAGDTQGRAGFNSDVKYVSMKVKVENATGLYVYYSAPSNTHQVSTTIKVDDSSEYLDQNGITGTLKNGEWITLKVPVKTDDPTSLWHMFTMKPNGTGSVLYIKDVKYLTETASQETAPNFQ